MEESFSVRVGKTFGTLPVRVPSSSLWSLTGEEIERREWNRDKGSPEPQLGPCNPNSKKDDFFGRELEKDLLELGDEDDVEEEEEEQSAKATAMPEGYDEEQWEIKNCIGLDPTLDHEEEEDEYDRVAAEDVKTGDPFLSSHPIDIDSQYEEVPGSLKHCFERDPRANHLAAQIRLRQDAEAAAQISLQESSQAAGNSASGAVGDEFITSEDAINPKSILKRKNDEQSGSSKSQKRVRFDPECKDDGNEEPDGSIDLPAKSLSGEDHASAVPDYIRNPSRYTHYTFDSLTDMDEEANRQAYMDFHNLLGQSNTMEVEEPRDFSKPVIFTPKKKSTDATMLEIDGELERPVAASKELAPYKVMPIAARDHEDSDVCAMDEDEPDTESSVSTRVQRVGRQFRTRTSLELDE